MLNAEKKALRKAGPPLEFGNRRREREREGNRQAHRERLSPMYVYVRASASIYTHACVQQTYRNTER